MGEMTMFLCTTQDSRPTLISAIEDCVYTFIWLTAAACPLNSSQHDNCRVTNPATGQTLKEKHQLCMRKKPLCKVQYLCLIDFE